jgi:hypothetical protein
LSTLALGLTQPSIQLVPGHFRGFIGRVVALTIHPYLAPWLKKEMIIFALPLGLCGLFQGELHIFK